MKKIITIFLILLSFFTLYAEDQQSVKAPFIAGVLSFSLTGIGQIYLHEYTKGSILIGADFLDKLFLGSLFIYYNYVYDNISWLNFTPFDRGILVGYLLYSFSIKMFSIIDAVVSAKRYNKNFLNKNKLAERMMINISSEKVTAYMRYSF